MQLVDNIRHETSYRFFPSGKSPPSPILMSSEEDKKFGKPGKKAVRLIFDGKTTFSEFEVEEIRKFKEYLKNGKVPLKHPETRDILLKWVFSIFIFLLKFSETGLNGKLLHASLLIKPRVSDSYLIRFIRACHFKYKVTFLSLEENMKYKNGLIGKVYAPQVLEILVQIIPKMQNKPLLACLPFLP